MSIELDRAFDLGKIRLEELNKVIARALRHFEDNPNINWTQIPIEKPLWETLKQCIESQIPKQVTWIEEVYENNFDGTCPMCESYVTSRETYCSECGQKLDWN